jgi:hypothetical protein
MLKNEWVNEQERIEEKIYRKGRKAAADLRRPGPT